MTCAQWGPLWFGLKHSLSLYPLFFSHCFDLFLPPHETKQTSAAFAIFFFFSKKWICRSWSVLYRHQTPQGLQETVNSSCHRSIVFLQHFCRDIESRLTWGGGVMTEAYKSHSSSIMSEKNVLPEAKRSLHLTRPLLSTLLCILLASWLP